MPCLKQRHDRRSRSGGVRTTQLTTGVGVVGCRAARRGRAGATLHLARGARSLSQRAAPYITFIANAGLPVTGGQADLTMLRDYFGALLAFVQSQVNAGRSREEILAMRDPLAGFESFGPFGRPSPRDALTCAYEEITAA